MGVVWRARDERLERVVAVKQLLPQPGLSEQQRQDARRRALREARIAARLHHANAIVVFDVAEYSGDPCLVMEYMAASSLSAMLAERGSLPAAEVAAIGSQIASALTAAHASGIVHRDVKPGNILINTEGVAKITDFGIAKAVGDVTVTQTGMFAGTPAYLAPEVARGQEPTSASDVFSFGATLYDAVEGGPPFPERQNQLALLRLVAEGKVQPPRQAGVLTSLLMQLLRSEAGERPTMAETSRMLGDLAAGRIPSAVPAGRPAPTLPGVTPVAEPQAEPPPPTPAPIPEPTVIDRPAQAPLLLSDRPAAYRPAAPPAPAPASPFGNRKRLALIGTLVVIVAIVVVGVVLASRPTSGSGVAGTVGAGSGSATSPAAAAPGTPSAPAGTSSAAPAGPPVRSAATSGVISFQPAGQLVVDFYNGLGDPAAFWARLTPAAQALYGADEAAFARYWAQYPSVSGAGAHQLTTNADGSVEVPINVTYAGGGQGAPSAQVHKTLRIVQQNGALFIDDDTRVQ